MCGIVGIIQSTQPVDEVLLKIMNQHVAHRGPDDEGIWLNHDHRVGLAHRRLAILDLSPAGHQPMTSPNGRYTITFNGEIYNYQILRNELQTYGWEFRSMSDTEVLLAAYAQWGKDCLKKFNGMFAFAIWDEEKQELFAARDRVGEKPFKYYYDSKKFIFASELKAILAVPGVSRDIDWQAIDVALSFRFVPAPSTGFRHIKKLPAGHYLTWKEGGVQVEQYWDVGIVPRLEEVSLERWKSQLWGTFTDAVKLRLVSDVPVGAFLSGGLDSSSVVAAMAEVSPKPVETFVISIGGESEDQRYARMVAQRFHTNHHELVLDDVLDPSMIDRIVDQYDEPFFDQSALPSLLISAEMKRHVTVVLSGDGADELFCGYSAYPFIRTLALYDRLPQLVRNVVAYSLACVSKQWGYQAEVMAKDFFAAYVDYYSVWQESLPHTHRYITKDDLYTAEFVQNIQRGFTTQLMQQWLGNGARDIANQAIMGDIRGRLADGYLTKMDMATMAAAVEVRPPFLDYRLVELSVQLPSHYKIRGGKNKWIWKEIVRHKLPADILRRPKVGFSIPLDRLLRGSWQSLVTDTILSSSSRVAEIFSQPTIQRLWRDHLDKKADYSNHLWSLVMLELWLHKYSGK